MSNPAAPEPPPSVGSSPPEEILTQVRSFDSISLQRDVLNASPHAVLVLNTMRQILFANKICVDIIGHHESNALTGKRLCDALQCVHALESTGMCGTTKFCQTCGIVRALLIGNQANIAPQECSIVREGDLEPFEWNISAAQLNVHGEVFILLTLMDIGNEKRRRTLERIFFHDVINIAGGIRGFLGVLNSAPSQKHGEIRAMLLQLANRLLDEIGVQRELAAAENNEITVISAVVESLNFLEEQCEAYRHHKVTEKRTILLHPDSVQCTIASDPALLGRVIGNMIKNALEASAVDGTVTVGCRQLTDRVEFWVHNSTFIPQKVQQQMFKRSYSTKGKHRGLGTYSVKLLCERYLEGSVSYATSEQEGTTFRVTVPMIISALKSEM
jgi:signal transduction histidine kinase